MHHAVVAFILILNVWFFCSMGATTAIFVTQSCCYIPILQIGVLFHLYGIRVHGWVKSDCQEYDDGSFSLVNTCIKIGDEIDRAVIYYCNKFMHELINPHLFNLPIVTRTSHKGSGTNSLRYIGPTPKKNSTLLRTTLLFCYIFAP